MLKKIKHKEVAEYIAEIMFSQYQRNISIPLSFVTYTLCMLN